MRRRLVDESDRARVPAVCLVDADRRGRAARRHRSVAGAALRPEHAAAARALDASGRDRGRARAGERLSGGRLPGAARGDRGLRGRHAGARRARSGRRRPDPALRARLRRAGRRDRDPAGADLPALPHRGAARRSASSRLVTRRIWLWHSPATRTTRPASSGPSRRCGRSSSTRRTSSTAGRRLCRCSTTA